MLKHLSCLLLIVFSWFGLAAENSSSILQADLQKGDIYKPQGLWPFLGAGLGVMDHNDSARSGGVPGHVKVLGSYYFNSAPWVADLGLGVHNEFVTQQGTGSDTIQSLYSELAGRYVFTNRWQLGAIWNTLIDNPHRYHSNDGSLATFVGAQALKEMTVSEEYVVRVGGRAMTSVGLNGGSVNTLMAELEVSFGSGNKPAVATLVPSPARPVLAPPVSVARAPHLDSQAMVSYQRAKTGTNVASEMDFKHLANSLADNQKLFKRVVLVGSNARTKAVEKRLVAAGLKPSQILRRRKGAKAARASATLASRHVRMEFEGVTNAVALKNVIGSVAR